jgi:hypothetical protein
LQGLRRPISRWNLIGNVEQALARILGIERLDDSVIELGLGVVRQVLRGEECEPIRNLELG